MAAHSRDAAFPKILTREEVLPRPVTGDNIIEAAAQSTYLRPPRWPLSPEWDRSVAIDYAGPHPKPSDMAARAWRGRYRCQTLKSGLGEISRDGADAAMCEAAFRRGGVGAPHSAGAHTSLGGRRAGASARVRLTARE